MERERKLASTNCVCTPFLCSWQWCDQQLQPPAIVTLLKTACHPEVWDQINPFSSKLFLVRCSTTATKGKRGCVFWTRHLVVHWVHLQLESQWTSGNREMGCPLAWIQHNHWSVGTWRYPEPSPCPWLSLWLSVCHRAPTGDGFLLLRERQEKRHHILWDYTQTMVHGSSNRHLKPENT